LDNHGLRFLYVYLVNLETKLGVVKASRCNFFNFLFSWRGFVCTCRNFEFAI